MSDTDQRPGHGHVATAGVDAAKASVANYLAGIEEGDIVRDLKRPKYSTSSVREDGVRINCRRYNASCVDFTVPNSNGLQNLSDFYAYIVPKFSEILVENLRKMKNVKFNIVIHLLFTNSVHVTARIALRSRNFLLLNHHEVLERLTDGLLSLDEQFLYRAYLSSGFMLQAILAAELRVNQYKFTRVGCALKLPAFILKKRACTVITKRDQRCFFHAINAVCPLSVVSPYRWDSITFPVNFDDIRKFLNMNPNVSLNIFSHEGRNIFPFKICDTEKETHINLLMTVRGKSAHFTHIHNINRLLGAGVTKHEKAAKFCMRCLLNFTTESRLQAHKKQCRKNKITSVRLQPEGSKFEFKRHNACQTHPFLIFLDTESLLVPLHGCSPPQDGSFTDYVNRHKLYAFGAVFYSDVNEEDLADIPHAGYFSYLGENASDELAGYLERMARGIEKILGRYYELNASAESAEKYKLARCCEICGCTFGPAVVKTFDHLHIQKRFNARRALCQSCNLRCTLPRSVICLVHNLNYDIGFILLALAKKGYKIDLVPCTSERFMAMTAHVGGIKVIFHCTFRMLCSSLDSYVSGVPREEFHMTQRAFPPEVQPFVYSKGIFCYKYLSSLDKLEESTLPDKEYFYDDLKEEPCSQDKYERAKAVWAALKCVSLRDYAHFYLKLDCYLLADSYLYFRNLFYKMFKLDPAFHMSLSQLSMNALLLYTGVKLDLISDAEIHTFVKESIYGGVCVVNTRLAHSSANNRLFLTDCTGLYGFIQYSRPLPTGGYQFVDPGSQDWLRVDCYGDRNYLIECDITFPDSVHDKLSDYPPIPERVCVGDNKMAKLICDLRPKSHIIIALPNLQQAISLGAVLGNVYKALSFEQAPFMRPYMEQLIKLRTETAAPAGKLMFKNAGNALWGKCCEDKSRHQNMRIVTSVEKLTDIIRKPSFVDRFHLVDNIFLVEQKKLSVLLDRPLCVGSLVLSWAKVYMCHIFYDVIKKNWGENVRLEMSDTDSMLLNVTTTTFEEDLSKIRSFFDFSSLPTDHKLYSTENKGRYGTFKCETSGQIITSFAAVRPKTYSYVVGEKTVNRAKGVGRAAVKKKLLFDHYKECVLSGKNTHLDFNTLLSKGLTQFTVKQRKLTLEGTDLKRVILPDGINTLPYGHYKLRRRNID